MSLAARLGFKKTRDSRRGQSTRPRGRGTRATLVEAEAAESRATAKAKRGKGKIRAKRGPRPAIDIKSLTVSEVAFLQDSETRQGLRRNLFRFIRDYISEHGPSNSNIDLNQDHGEFPVLYDKLLYEEPFTDTEIETLAADPRLRDSSYSVVVEGEKKKVSFDVTKVLKQYNTLVSKYRYFQVRSRILHILNRNKPVPDFALDILHRDLIFSRDDISTLSTEYRIGNDVLDIIKQYNRLLESGPHIPLVQDTEVVSRPTAVNVDEQVIRSLAGIRESLHKARESSDNAALKTEIAEEEADAVGLDAKTRLAPDLTGEVHRHNEHYREAIRNEIITESEDPTKIVTDADINAFMLARQNLPIWAFMATFIASPISRENTIKHFKLYPEIPAQFVHLFQRLLTDQQVEFITVTFQAFPPEDFIDGPDISLVSLLIQFYNEYIDWSPSDEHQSLDLQLANMPTDKFSVLFKSLSPAQALRNREIIFGRLKSLNERTQLEILAYYNGLLIIPHASLTYSDENGVFVEFDELSYRPTNIDFGLPFDEATRSMIVKFLQKNIPTLINIAGIKTVPTVKNLSTIMIPRRTGPLIPIVVYIKLILFNYFMANLPRSVDFAQFLQDAIISSISDSLSGSAPQDNIEDISIDLPENLVEVLDERLDDIRRNEKLSLNAIDLQSQAAKLNLRMDVGISMAKDLAIQDLNTQLAAKQISKDQYKGTIRQINDFVGAYRKLDNRTARADIDMKDKRRQIAKAYDDKVRELKNEAQAAGKALTESDIDEIQDQARQSIVESGIVTPDEWALLDLAKTNKAPIQGTLSRKNRVQLKNIVKTMPDALRLSLQIVLDNIAKGMQAIDDEKKGEVSTYYKFVIAVIISAWKWKQAGDALTLEQIETEYSEKLPLAFIKKILDMLKQKNMTGAQLLKYVADYTRKRVTLIKNPLIRQTIRRKRRYDQIFQSLAGAGSLDTIRRALPETLSPHLKECITIHKLKPWLDIPNIQDWTLLIASPSGKKRSDMPPMEKAYFNMPTLNIPIPLNQHEKTQGLFSQEFVLNLSGDKHLYFYRPTTAYWIKHCQSHHASLNSCNENALIKDFSLGGNKASFYELLIKPPVAASKVSNDAIEIDYNGDTDDLILLSADPSVYQRECAWFRLRYTPTEKKLLNIRNSPMDSQNALIFRTMAREQIRIVLSMLAIRLGIDVSTNSGNQEAVLIENAKELENAIYQLLVEKNQGVNFNVNDYLRELYLFLIFTDLTNPLLNNRTEVPFFASLVAQCARAYYPVLLRQFSTSESRLPEVLLNLSQKARDVKDDVQYYIEQSLEVLVEQAIAKTIGNDTMSRSISALLTKRMTDLTAALPDISGPTLKNICVNANDYKGMKDSWLAYYVSGKNVYCVSKLQLANMAQTKKYNLNGIKFDPAFVDSFALYAEFSANELQARNKYIENIINSLVSMPENSAILEELAQQYNHSGKQFTATDLQKIGIFDKIKSPASDDSYLIMIMTNRINDVLEMYNSKKILDAARQFVKSNNDKLLNAIQERYTSYHQNDPLTSSSLDKKSAIQPFIDQQEYNTVVLDPVADIVTRSIIDTTGLIPSDNDRASIIHMISDLIHSEPSAGADDAECEFCHAKINAEVTVDKKKMDDQILSELKEELESKKIAYMSKHGITDNQLKYELSSTDESVPAEIKNMRVDQQTIDRFMTDEKFRSEIVNLRRSAKWNMAGIRTGEQSYQTMMQYREGLATKTKMVKFCSSKCFSKYKIKEPSYDDVKLARLQNNVNTVTRVYLDYTQMLQWARFPASFHLPTGIAEQNALVSAFSKIKGIPEEDVREILPNLSREENMLGIVVADRMGRRFSQTELWDRIRTHSMFVPSISELLTEEKLKALLHLAREFNVPVYGDDWEEAESYYTADPEELRNIWKTLRVNQSFQKVLFSTVKTFDPYKPQLGADLVSGYIAPVSAPLDIDKFTAVSNFIRPGVQSIPNLGAYLSVSSNFKALREDILNKTAAQFPALFVYDHRNTALIRDFRNTLEYWFNIHRYAIVNQTPASVLNQEREFSAGKVAVSSERTNTGIEALKRKRHKLENIEKQYKALKVSDEKASANLLKSNNLDSITSLQKQIQEATNQIATADSDEQSESILSSDQLVNEMGRLCNVVTLEEFTMSKAITLESFSQWTIELIKNNQDPEMMSFTLDFYPHLLSHYKCSEVVKMEEAHARFVFNLEKVNSIIDDIFAQTIWAAQKPYLASGTVAKPFTGFAKRRHVARKQVREEELSSAAIMLRNIQPIGVEFGWEPKSFSTVLSDIRQMRQKLHESEKEKKSGQVKGKIKMSIESAIESAIEELENEQGKEIAQIDRDIEESGREEDGKREVDEEEVKEVEEGEVEEYENFGHGLDTRGDDVDIDNEEHDYGAESSEAQEEY